MCTEIFGGSRREQTGGRKLQCGKGKGGEEIGLRSAVDSLVVDEKKSAVKWKKWKERGKVGRRGKEKEKGVQRGKRVG